MIAIGCCHVNLVFFNNKLFFNVIIKKKFYLPGTVNTVIFELPPHISELSPGHGDEHPVVLFDAGGYVSPHKHLLPFSVPPNAKPPAAQAVVQIRIELSVMIPKLVVNIGSLTLS